MLLVHFPDNSNILNHRLKDLIPRQKKRHPVPLRQINNRTDRKPAPQASFLISSFLILSFDIFLALFY